MINIYVLDAPEFAEVCAAAARAGMSREVRGDYVHLSCQADAVTVPRPEGTPEAVWFGALTGGVDGLVTDFCAGSLSLAAVDSGEGR